MRKALWALALAACAPHAPVKKAPVESPAAPPPGANFTVTAYEVVEKPEDDVAAFLKVFIDGAPAGETARGPKSAPKRWDGAVVPGNHPLRLEYYVAASSSEWTRLSEDLAPRERFVRVSEGEKVKVEVKFYDQARKNELTVTREGGTTR